LAQVGSAIFSFASVWLINKRLGAEGYGGVVAIIAASQVAQILVNWTAVSVVRFGTEEFVETEKITRAFWLRLFIFLPNLLLVWLAAPFWFPPLASWLKLSAEMFWFVLLHFAASVLWIHVQFSLQSAKLPRVQGFLLMIERLLVFAGILTLSIVGGLNSFSAILSYTVAPFLMVIVGVWHLRHFLFARFLFNWQFLRKIIVFSLPLLPFSLVGYFSGSYTDAIFVSKFLSTRDLGLYSVAYQINGMLMQFPLLAGSLLLPFFVTLQTNKNIEKVKVYMQDILPLLTLIGGVGGICVAFVMKFFIYYMFAENYANITIIFWILVSSATFGIPGYIGYVPYINSSSVTYIATINAVIAAVINLSANFFLIPSYGLKGCAWATVLAYGVSFLVVSYIMNRRFSLERKWLIPAIIPSIVGSAYASWTEDLVLSLILTFVSAFVVVLLYRNSFTKSLKMLVSYRNLFLKNF
jgi:O-antigen/teichoic acid export membrane protein